MRIAPPETLRILMIPLILALASTTDAGAAELAPTQKIVTTIAGERAGNDISASGDRCLVGAPGRNSLAGAAYVYEFDGTQWVEQQQLTASDTASFDFFGGAVALEGDVALIGASSAGLGDTGAVYVFGFNGSTWVEEQILTASDGVAFDNFGGDVALDGDRALITASSANGNAGKTYAFRFDGSSWIEEQTLTASDGAADDRFGGRVALDGTTAVITASGDDGFLGAAYVFRFDGSSWSEEQKLVASDGLPKDFFGGSVTLEQDVAIVGSPFGNTSRAAYIYRFDGSTWVEEQKLVRPDFIPVANFGAGIALRGNDLLIGDYFDSVFTYRYDGATWNLGTRLPSDEVFLGMGESIAYREDGSALVGASMEATGGAVYFFSPELCLAGTVDAGGSGPVDTLLINGSAGGSDRTLIVNEEELDQIVVTVLAPPAGSNGKFVLHGNEGLTSITTAGDLPASIGTTCFPLLFSEGASPVIIANNIGKTSQVGESGYFGSPTADPERATTSILYPSMPMGTVLSFQAVIVDAASLSPKGVSVTNHVTLVVQ